MKALNPVPTIEDNLSEVGYFLCAVGFDDAEEDDKVADWLGVDEPTVVLDTGMFSVKVSRWGRCLIGPTLTPPRPPVAWHALLLHLVCIVCQPFSLEHRGGVSRLDYTLLCVYRLLALSVLLCVSGQLLVLCL